MATSCFDGVRDATGNVGFAGWIGEVVTGNGFAEFVKGKQFAPRLRAAAATRQHGVRGEFVQIVGGNIRPAKVAGLVRAGIFERDSGAVLFEPPGVFALKGDKQRMGRVG